MGVRIQELPETTGINKEDVLIVEDGQGTKKGTVQQLDEALGVSQLKEDLDTLNQGGLNLKEDFIGRQVDNWLSYHPEATTTVQDGAITEPKIHADFLPYIKNGYLTPQMFGAKGDGVTDDTNAFNEAISYANTNNKTLFVPNGKYIITDNLIELNAGFNLIGESNGASEKVWIQMNHQQGYGIIVNQDCDIENIFFSGSDIAPCMKVNGGWTATIKKCRFEHFTTAIDAYGPDVWIDHCMFVFCGIYANSKVNYAFVLNEGSNHYRITSCHFEHCRYYIYAGDNSAYNIVTNCKFEQSTYGINSNMDDCIISNGWWQNPRIVFNGCTFSILHVDAYLEKGSFTSYDNAPRFFGGKGILIENCELTENPGSASFQCLETHRNGTLPIYLGGWSMVKNCVITGVANVEGAITLIENSHIDGCRVEKSRNNTTLIEQTYPEGVAIVKGYTYNCTSRNYVLTNNFNYTNKVIGGSAVNYAPYGTRFEIGSGDTYRTVCIQMVKGNNYNVPLKINTASLYHPNVNFNYDVTLTRQNGNTPTVEITTNDSNKQYYQPLKIYYDKSKLLYYIQTKVTTLQMYSESIIKVLGLEQYPLTIYNMPNQKTELHEDDNIVLLGTM